MSFLKTVEYNPEPGFIPALSRALRENRVVHLVGVHLQGDAAEFYERLTDQLGEIVPADEDAVTGNRDQKPNRWTDIRYDAEQAKYFRHSSTQQPLHTDTAYTSYDNDVNFFFCKEQAAYGGATTFIDGQLLLAIMQEYAPQLLSDLSTHEVIFDKGTTERKVKRILEVRDGEVYLNWNYFRVSQQNRQEVQDLCQRFHEFLEEKIVKGGIPTALILAPGECVFFQDNHILHGRNAFFGGRTLIKGALNWRIAQTTAHT